MIKAEKELPILKAILTDSNFKQAFEQEISEAPKKPDVVKYWQHKGINVDDPNELEQRETELRKLNAEFAELIVQNKVPENCYINDVRATHTYKILKQAQSIFNHFKALKTDYLNTGEGIVNELTELSHKPVIGQIIDVIIQDNESIPAIIKKQENEYNREKLKLNNYLKNYLKKELPKTPETITYNETFIGLIEEVESKFNPLDKTNIQIAAFTEIMFDKGWLANRKNRLKACNEFARSRYKKNVNASLTATNKAVRETHKAKIMKYFK